MPTAYLGCKYRPGGANRRWVDQLDEALATEDWSLLHVERDVERWGEVQPDATTLMEETFAMIDRSDIVIIDLAEKGVGLGIEAGYARARGVPVLAALPHDADLSRTLEGIATTVVRYGSADDIVMGLVDVGASA